MTEVYWQKCPVCNGYGFVSYPHGVAGDFPQFTSTDCGPWPCHVCNGLCIIPARDYSFWPNFNVGQEIPEEHKDKVPGKGKS